MDIPNLDSFVSTGAILFLEQTIAMIIEVQRELPVGVLTVFVCHLYYIIPIMKLVIVA